MPTFLIYLALVAIMVAPFVLLATLAALARRAGALRLHRDQVRVAAPMIGPLHEDVRIRTSGFRL